MRAQEIINKNPNMKKYFMMDGVPCFTYGEWKGYFTVEFEEELNKFYDEQERKFFYGQTGSN